MHMERIDVAVVGGGVTGLASARAIAARGFSTCVLERHPRPGLDTSTHNSGVIHAGIYYPAGIAEGARCASRAGAAVRVLRRARRAARAHAARSSSPTSDRRSPRSRRCSRAGSANGVEGLALVDSAFVAAREPHVHAVAALYSPESGIVDAEALVKALLRAGRSGRRHLPAGTRLIGADCQQRMAIELRTERETILARQVVNAAGLYADEVSRMLGGEAFTIYPCRGEYAELTPAKRPLVNSLVYPLAASRATASACTS